MEMVAPYIESGLGSAQHFHIGRRPEIKPEIQARRARQDQEMARVHAYLDEAAKDNRMKYERPSFAVVGEGTRSSQERYRQGWEAIFGTSPEAATPR